MSWPSTSSSNPPGHEPLAERLPAACRGAGTGPQPQPLLVAAAIDFARGEDAASEAALDAAEGLLGRLPAGDEIPSRLAAALIRLGLARRPGTWTRPAAAAGDAQDLVEALPEDRLARHPGIRAQVLAGRGAVELWSGRLRRGRGRLRGGRDSRNGRRRAYRLPRPPRPDRGAAGTAEPGRRAGRRGGRAGRTTIADRPPGPASQAAELALACVHLDRNELSRARRWLKRAEDALRGPAGQADRRGRRLVAARHSLAEGRRERGAGDRRTGPGRAGRPRPGSSTG